MKTGLTLEELCAEITRQNAAKSDYAVDTRRLEMQTGGQDVVLRMLDDAACDLVEPMDVNQAAHRQIGTFTDIPAKYYDRMREENPGLLAHNVNSWFQSEPAPRMLRTLDGTARAFSQKTVAKGGGNTRNK
ncbi:MAG: hypothetical protein LBT12_07060 [Oscillospiraceae bacterium]|jgi:hypothetical protein|nr:hypothetical protein [Oscillospiraceae bacterium]